MNTLKGRAKFKNFRILFNSVFSSMIVMGRLVTKLDKKNDVMQCHTQVGNITTNLKVKVYFASPETSATRIMTWNFHVDDSTKGRYGMIIGRDLLP